MARIVKPKEKWHVLRMRCDRNDGELILSGRGKRSYLWVAKDAMGVSITTYSGRITLIKLARAILKEMGPLPHR